MSAGQPNPEANKLRILNVQNCFGKWGKVLYKEGRVLIGEGILTKVCRKKPKQRQFFLFNDLLVYGTVILNKKRYTNQRIMSLYSVSVVNLPDHGSFKNAWQIKSPSRSFTVFCATALEKTEWVNHITRALQALDRSGGPSDTERAAVWTPDAATNICMNCYKTRFSAVSRRHHCRNCGAVICGSCSKGRFLLPAISNKPSRVCSGCLQTLTHNSSDDPHAAEEEFATASLLNGIPVKKRSTSEPLKDPLIPVTPPAAVPAAATDKDAVMTPPSSLTNTSSTSADPRASGRRIPQNSSFSVFEDVVPEAEVTRPAANTISSTDSRSHAFSITTTDSTRSQIHSAYTNDSNLSRSHSITEEIHPNVLEASVDALSLGSSVSNDIEDETDLTALSNIESLLQFQNDNLRSSMFYTDETPLVAAQ